MVCYVFSRKYTLCPARKLASELKTLAVNSLDFYVPYITCFMIINLLCFKECYFTHEFRIYFHSYIKRYIYNNSLAMLPE